MGTYMMAGKTSEFSDGTMKAVVVQGREVLLARVGGKYYAINNRCPHMGGDLSLGKLDGTIVTCPRHSSQFDLTDGRVIRWTNWSGIISRVSQMIKSPRPVATYPVKVEGDNVTVEI